MKRAGERCGGLRQTVPGWRGGMVPEVSGRSMSSVDSRYGGGGKDRSAWTLRWLMDSSDEEHLGKRLVN